MENQLVPRPGNPNWVGRSGNPAGRPIGARGRFSQQFIVDLSAAWERYGAEALAKTAEQFPDRFVGICAHLIPERRTGEPYGPIAGRSTARGLAADVGGRAGRETSIA